MTFLRMNLGSSSNCFSDSGSHKSQTTLATSLEKRFVGNTVKLSGSGLSFRSLLLMLTIATDDPSM